MSAPESPLPPVALRQRREHVIQVLCRHFALDHLETAELEALIDRAHRAASVAELDQLTAGLPALAAPPASKPSVALDRSLPDRGPQLVVAIMGGAERKGAWRPARQTTVVAFMGGVSLDFRDAVLSADVTEIDVLAIMGGVEIVVPPGVHVESSGIGIMGGFEHSGQGRFPVDASVPVLRISGLALMGGVEIRDTPSGSHPAPGDARLRGGRGAAPRLGDGLADTGEAPRRPPDQG